MCHHWGDLGDDHSDCIIRSVSFNNNGFIRVEMRQDGCLSKGCLSVFEQLVWLGAQVNRVSLPGEVN